MSPSALSSQHVFLRWINAWSLLCLYKNGWFICFHKELQSLSVCVSAVSRVSDNTMTWTILFKTWSLLFVCVCHPALTAKGLDMSCLWHMPHPDWLFLLFLSLPCSLHNPPGGKAFRVFAVIWVPQRAASPNRKQLLGCWIGGNQALLSNSMSEMFLALLHFRG